MKWIRQAGIFMLILLWTYTALSKLSNFSSFRQEMANQVFSPAISGILVYAIPFLELLAAGLLIFSRSQRWGLILSVLLLVLFTGYILLVLGGYFPRTPCSCGGVLKILGWWEHLWFNVFFLGLAILCGPARPPDPS